MKKVIILILVLAAYCVSLPAATVYLNSGKVVEGDIVEETEEYIKVKHVYGDDEIVLTYYTDAIQKIEGGSAEEDSSLAGEDAQELKEKARALLLQEQHEEAIKIFEQLLERDPADVEVLNLLSTTCMFVGDCQRALDFGNKAIEVDPSNIEGYTNLGAIYGECFKDYEKKIELCEEALKIKKDFAMAYLGMGYAYKEMGKRDLAVEYFTEAERLYRQQGQDSWADMIADMLRGL